MSGSSRPATVAIESASASHNRNELSRAGTPRPIAARLAKTWPALRSNPNTLIGIVVLAVIVVLTVAAPVFAGQDALETAPRERLQGPSWSHPFGTDELGRDLWSRVLYGGRISLWAGFIAVAIGVTGGIIVGLVAGFYGGWVDMLLMRIADVMMAMPGILLTMVFIFSLGPSLTNAMISIGIAAIPDYARVIRGSVLSAREQVYVDAARVLGMTPMRIMRKHVLANVVAPTLILGTIGIGAAILSLAGLSFLGLGAQPPTPEWGVIISNGRARMGTAWWISTFPGIAIALSVIAINLIGDGLRDVFDPRLRHR